MLLENILFGVRSARFDYDALLSLLLLIFFFFLLYFHIAIMSY